MDKGEVQSKNPPFFFSIKDPIEPERVVGMNEGMFKPWRKSLRQCLAELKGSDPGNAFEEWLRLSKLKHDNTFMSKNLQEMVERETRKQVYRDERNEKKRVEKGYGRGNKGGDRDHRRHDFSPAGRDGDVESRPKGKGKKGKKGKEGKYDRYNDRGGGSPDKWA